MTDTEIAYFAGIVDGEGSIGVRRGKVKYITPMLQVTNTNRALLDWISVRFGGSVYKNCEPRIGRRQLWSWQVWGHNAQSLISSVLPYLVIKRPQAELALTIRRHSNRSGSRPVMTSEDFAENHRVYLRFRELNKRGTR